MTHAPFSRTETIKMPVGKILVDSSYQRPLDPAHARKLARAFATEWDEAAFGTLGCSLRDEASDYVYVFDGQHRRTGFEEQFGPNALVLVTVTRGMGKPDEARAFVRRNELKSGRHKTLSTVEILRAGQVGEIPECVGTIAGIEKAGFSLDGDNALDAPSAAVTLYSLGGERLVYRTLRAIAEAWEYADKSTSSAILTGVGQYLNQNPKVTDETLVLLLGDSLTEFRAECDTYGDTTRSRNGKYAPNDVRETLANRQQQIEMLPKRPKGK